MAEREGAQPIIVNSLAAGEVAPGLYARADLAKFHQGAFTMTNFFVDYKGGATYRPGTQFLGESVNTNQFVKLVPFKYSTAIGQTYILVFSDQKVEFIKNPGTASYPNSSNSGFITSGGPHYTVTTPYVAGDISGLKFSQLGNILTITHPSYARRTLTRITDTNWVLAVVDDNSIASPTMTAVTISALPPGSTDPAKTRYIYTVTTVDRQGNESLPAVPLVSAAGIDISITLGTVTVTWSGVGGAQYYKVYKGLQGNGDKYPEVSQGFGFVGFAYGNLFVDDNVVPDFAQSPLIPAYPFEPGFLNGWSIAASSADWPVGGTTLTLAGGAPTRAGRVYPILDTNAAATNGHIVGIWIADPGYGYSSAPTVTAAGGGTTFTATMTISPQTGMYPAVSGLFQQRQMYAATNNNPNEIFGSRTGTTADFRTSNPTIASDALSLVIASPQVNTIEWMRSMPGGLVVGTNSGVVQLTGGSASATNPAAVTPGTAVIVPQSFFGSADVEPIVINYDILYIQNEGSIVRDLQYNFFVNIYTGTDLTIVSSHLFYPKSITSWDYQDVPNKIIWAARSDGVLLSLTYLKEQEIIGWAKHFFGLPAAIESIAVVPEGTVDAVYMSLRFGTALNPPRYIVRLCEQVYATKEDAINLDFAVTTFPVFPAARITPSAATGAITITASAAVFGGGDVGKVIRYSTAKAQISGFIDTTHVTANVDPGYPFPGVGIIDSGQWRMDATVSTVGGLAHLNGQTVYALADGNVQGPFTPSGGSITLTTPASQIAVGATYVGDLQPLYADVGSEKGTIQGTRKKITAATLRIKDTLGVNYGVDFNHLKAFIQGQSGTDPIDAAIPPAPPGLVTGDIRMIINQQFNRVGSVAIRQANPLPCTILGIIPELTDGR